MHKKIKAGREAKELALSLACQRVNQRQEALISSRASPYAWPLHQLCQGTRGVSQGHQGAAEEPGVDGDWGLLGDTACSPTEPGWIMGGWLIPYIISTTASSLKIPFSTVLHLPELIIRSSLKGYLSLTANKIHHHRLKDCVLFPNALSMPLSIERGPSCLASLLPKTRLLVPPSQQWSIQVAAQSTFGVGWFVSLPRPPAFVMASKPRGSSIILHI